MLLVLQFFSGVPALQPCKMELKTLDTEGSMHVHISVPKVFISKKYENGHKNISGVLVVLESKVEISQILILQSIFQCKKLPESF